MIKPRIKVNINGILQITNTEKLNSNLSVAERNLFNKAMLEVCASNFKLKGGHWKTNYDARF